MGWQRTVSMHEIEAADDGPALEKRLYQMAADKAIGTCDDCDHVLI